MASDGAFLFRMRVPYGVRPFPWCRGLGHLSELRSNIKVKVKMAVMGHKCLSNIACCNDII